jgi:hypothetical protein
VAGGKPRRRPLRLLLPLRRARAPLPRARHHLLPLARDAVQPPRQRCFLRPPFLRHARRLAVNQRLPPRQRRRVPPAQPPRPSARPPPARATCTLRSRIRGCIGGRCRRARAAGPASRPRSTLKTSGSRRPRPRRRCARCACAGGETACGARSPPCPWSQHPRPPARAALSPAPSAPQRARHRAARARHAGGAAGRTLMGRAPSSLFSAAAFLSFACAPRGRRVSPARGRRRAHRRG